MSLGLEVRTHSYSRSHVEHVEVRLRQHVFITNTVLSMHAHLFLFPCRATQYCVAVQEEMPDSERKRAMKALSHRLDTIREFKEREREEREARKKHGGRGGRSGKGFDTDAQWANYFSDDGDSYGEEDGEGSDSDSEEESGEEDGGELDEELQFEWAVPGRREPLKVGKCAELPFPGLGPNDPLFPHVAGWSPLVEARKFSDFCALLRQPHPCRPSNLFCTKVPLCAYTSADHHRVRAQCLDRSTDYFTRPHPFPPRPFPLLAHSFFRMAAFHV